MKDGSCDIMLTLNSLYIKCFGQQGFWYLEADFCLCQLLFIRVVYGTGESFDFVVTFNLQYIPMATLKS